MAVTGFLHGVEVQEVIRGARSIRTVRSANIGMVGTAPNADPVSFPLNQPVVVVRRGEAALLDTVGNGAGTLPSALDAIFDQIGALCIVVRVAEGASQAETLSNILGDITGGGTGAYTGVHALSGAESITGFQPRILCAPGFTHLRPNGNANPVVAELVGIAEQLRAVIIADGPNTTDQAAYDYRDDWGSPRVYIADPWVTRFDRASSTLVDMPPSAHIAGLMAKIDNDLGFWHSPSNQTINGIIGTSRPIDFALGSSTSRANLLNENDVTTIINSNGYRLWGNRTASADPKWAFLNVRRAADLIQDSILRAHLWALDRNLVATYYEEVVEGVNAYIRTLVSLGALVGGECIANPDLNSPSERAAGRAYFDIRFSVAAPAEHIVFRSELTNDYLTEVFN